MLLQQEAQKKGCEQVLWLYGPDHQLTEVGTMNIFIYWTHEDGGEPTMTQPTLDGIPSRLQGPGILGEGEAPRRMGSAGRLW